MVSILRTNVLLLDTICLKGEFISTTIRQFYSVKFTNLFFLCFSQGQEVGVVVQKEADHAHLINLNESSIKISHYKADEALELGNKQRDNWTYR